MKRIALLSALIICISCKEKKQETVHKADNLEVNSKKQSDFTIIFVSCNDQDMEQPLWKPIIDTHPDVFIWGGDNIYADTDDMEKMKNDYNKILNNPDYVKLESITTVIGTWDDHDYGKNDAGVEWNKKVEAQQLFLDFIKIPKDDIRRIREGVYHSQIFNSENGSIKVILLDTRYFRSPLKRSTVKGRRFESWGENDSVTILGEIQWKWLEEELQDNTTNFTIIVSSIQFLADEHDWEKWGNYPSEVKKMYQKIIDAKANNIFILSGDRHLAEFSVAYIEGLSYPLIDFTTSGLTKTYPDSPDEYNRYRVGDQIKQLNFGVLIFDFENNKVTMEIRGVEGKMYEELVQEF